MDTTRGGGGGAPGRGARAGTPSARRGGHGEGGVAVGGSNGMRNRQTCRIDATCLERHRELRVHVLTFVHKNTDTHECII